NTEAWQWTPNLIWVDSLNVMPTPNYFVQQMFAKNHGDEILPLEMSGLPDETSLFASAVKDAASGEVILKVVNPGGNPAEVELDFAGLSSGLSGKQIMLTGDNSDAMNTMNDPRHLAPVETALSPSAPKFTHTFPPRSFTVLRLKSR